MCQACNFNCCLLDQEDKCGCLYCYEEDCHDLKDEDAVIFSLKFIKNGYSYVRNGKRGETARN